MSQAASLSPGDLHDDQIVALLRSGAHAALLIAYFGEIEYRELSQLAKLAAIRRKRRGRLVFVLPGVMGSRLGVVRRGVPHLLWLHPTAVGAGGLLDLALPGSRSIRAVGVMLPGYLKLKLSLEVAGLRPVFHPFDWRLDIDRLARSFMQRVESCGARKVFVLAHSMGGLVARAALAHDKQHRIERLLQVGSPNEGSFAPVQALRAVYPTVRKIAALGDSHTAEQLAHAVFLTLPGLYQMLPTHDSDADVDLFDADRWPDDELRPDRTLLARARRLRARMPPADDRCGAIIGTNQETITSVTRRHDEFQYEIRRDGDGTVPTARACWPGAPAWYVDENHGALTQNDLVLAAIADVLRSGDTARITARAPTPADGIVRRTTDTQLRARATRKVRWESLSVESRRRILDPFITPEFEAPQS
ncbi:MAG: lipase family alpha/beta hydrolase [Steroidobacter sp.]